MRCALYPLLLRVGCPTQLLWPQFCLSNAKGDPQEKPFPMMFGSEEPALTPFRCSLNLYPGSQRVRVLLFLRVHLLPCLACFSYSIRPFCPLPSSCH